jgi:TPR repeat protein
LDSRQSRVAIARVEGGGTAFAISNELALTARHVLGPQLQAKPDQAAVGLRFADGDWIDATVEQHDTTSDVAILRLRSPGLPPNLMPLPISTVVRYRQGWRAQGYPEVMGDRLTIDGTVTDPDARLEGSASAMQLGCRQVAASSPLPLSGFSGSPVIDQDSGAVIGIVRLEFRNPEKPGAVGGDIWATSLRYVAELWPELVGPLVQRRRKELRTELAELMLHGLSPSGELPRVCDMEVHAVGATPTRYSMQDRAPYVRRPQVDTELGHLLRQEHAIVVVGPSSAGKSRTAFQAVRTGMPQAGFAHPRPTRQAVRQLMRFDREEPLCEGPLVLWLDELDEYLSEESISPALVDWIQERDGGGVIVATIRDDQYAEIRGSALKAGKGVRLFLDRLDRGYFFLGHRITEDEAELAARLYPGQDFGDLQLGIGLKLVAGPELVGRLRSAEIGNPRGWAVVKAAVDYIWMGLPPPIPGTVLRQLFDVVMRAESPQLRCDEKAYRQGVDWACERAVSGVSLLSRTQLPDHSRKGEAFELVDQAEEFGLQHRWQICADSWRVALSVAAMEDLLVVSTAARMHDAPEVAVSALRKAAESGSSSGAIDLGMLLAQDADIEEAKRWVEKAVQAGDPDAPLAMGTLLAQAGDFDEAREWFWRGVGAGALEAAFLMGQLAQVEERLDEATYWLRIAAEEGEDAAWLSLAQVHHQLDDRKVATECLKRGAAGEGVIAALCRLQLATDAGDDAAAGEWLQVAADLGDVDALRTVGQMLGEQGHISEAEHLLRRAARSDPQAEHDLGVLYEIAGDAAAARGQYERAYDRKAASSAAALARLSFASGDVTGAAAWLRAEADSPGSDPEVVCPVAVELAQALRRQGRNTEAATWLQEGADAGYVPAMALLGSIAMADRDTDTAERWLMEAARAGYPDAAGRLGEVLEGKDEISRAARWLKVAAEAEADSDEPGRAAEALARVNGYLAAERQRQPGPEADQWLAEGIAAQERGDDRTAGLRFAMAAGDGNVEAAYRYGTILRAGNDKSGAERYLRMAAERGHTGAAAALVFLVSDPLEQRHWLEIAHSANEPVVLRTLAQSRLEANDLDGTERLLRQLAETGDLIAAGALGGLLQSRGETDEAREWLTMALDAEAEAAAHAAHNLGVNAVIAGDRAKAMTWFRQAAEADMPTSMIALATLLREEGDHGQADSLLMRAFEIGDMQAAAELAMAKHERGDPTGALRWAAAAAERGHIAAAYMAGRLSYHAGNHEDAEKWLRIAVDFGRGEARVRLAALVARRGDLPAAEAILAGAVSRGNGLALYAAGDLASRRGWMSAAESYFVAAVDAGHLFAALDAAALADLRGDAESKTRWLQRWQSGGTMSSTALAFVEDYHEIGLTIFRNAPWEPGQPMTYGVSTPFAQTWINSESGLDLPLD